MSTSLMIFTSYIFIVYRLETGTQKMCSIIFLVYALTIYMQTLCIYKQKYVTISTDIHVKLLFIPVSTTGVVIYKWKVHESTDDLP